MANIYLSFLGTNDYLDCTYFHNDQEVSNVRFVQEAIIKVFCSHYSPADRLIFFLTDEAEQKNWDEGFYKDDAGKSKTGLKQRLKSLSLSPAVIPVKIEEGRNEADIWKIFQIVYNNINPEDRVIFDITHAFRSLPMLAMVILPYAQVMKNISLEGIYYGAFEVLGTISEVKKMPLEQRRAPIFNLTPFGALLDWTLAIDRFLGAGDAAPVHKLAKCYWQPKLSEGKDSCADSVRQLADNLAAFSKNLGTSRCRTISRVAVQLKDNLNQPLDIPLPALEPLLDQIRNRMAVFTGDPINDGIQAVRWCLQHNLIQQGYTILRETIISYVLQQTKLAMYSRENREQVIYAASESLKKSLISHNNKTDPTIYRQLYEFCQTNKGMSKNIRKIGDIRNDLNHCGCREDPKQATFFADELKRLLSDIQNLI